VRDREALPGERRLFDEAAGELDQVVVARLQRHRRVAHAEP